MLEKTCRVTYSASNKETTDMGAFTVTLNGSLESLAPQIIDTAMAEIKLKNYTKLQVAIALQQ
ncbi:hypothetical protein [Muricauda sp. MAR_2010_75]|uniref:hypothetical protein n=1 Tax=Allomuricauda sp. MAR_2010_75 TaxID=1250232 RepID=UPI00055A9249|nr:hypothetical protein [Muricauda sp. MAR_2010_75]